MTKMWDILLIGGILIGGVFGVLYFTKTWPFDKGGPMGPYPEDFRKKLAEQFTYPSRIAKTRAAAELARQRLPFGVYEDTNKLT